VVGTWQGSYLLFCEQMADDDSFAAQDYSLTEGESDQTFAIGMHVLAQYMEDSEWYDAEIIEFIEDEEIWVVVFTEYGNEQECTAEMLQHKPVAKPAPKAAVKAAPAAKTAATKKLVMVASLLDDDDVDEIEKEEEAKRKAADDAKRKAEAEEAKKKAADDIKKAAERKAAEEASKKKPAPVAPAKRTPDLPRKTGDVARKSGAPPTRRQLAEQRRKTGKSHISSQAYDDDDSVLHGVDDINVIVEKSECDLFLALDKLENASSSLDVIVLASTLSELAVLPCTPAADAEGYWKQAFDAANRAVEGEPESTGILTQAAHLHLRYGLYWKQQGQQQKAQSSLKEAVTKYRHVFDIAPVRSVLKYIVYGLSQCPSISLHRFLGLTDKGYSRALLRANEEKSYYEAIDAHLAKLSESSFAEVTFPLLRAHCFGVLRMSVIGFAIAVAEDLPEDQASLLLHGWDALGRIGCVEEALLLGYYLLKLNAEVSDIGLLSDSVGGIRDYAVRCNFAKIADSVSDATDEEMSSMANAELDDVLACMTEYDPNEVICFKKMYLFFASFEIRF
jgi:tetratricopeptide (TPR) repeat protein